MTDPQPAGNRTLVLDRVRIIDPVTRIDRAPSRITVTGSLISEIIAVRDLGAPSGLNAVLAERLDRGIANGPAGLASGRAVVMTVGHVWTFGREADGPWDCRRAVREQAKAGARVIKIMGPIRSVPHGFGSRNCRDQQEKAAVGRHRRGICR